VIVIHNIESKTGLEPALATSSHRRGRLTHARASALPARLRSHDLEPRKVRAVASGIAGEQDQAGDCRVCADVEIRQGGSTAAAPLPIPDEAFPGEEGRLPRKGKS